jgi:GTP-binding protein EngB required for normal cell division
METSTTPGSSDAPRVSQPIDAGPDVLRRCLDRLLEAADAADVLGLATDDIRTATDDVSKRLGFPSDVYVLALVGGTGVGKSSLLNSLAGVIVSPASVRRPTTREPIAWVPDTDKAALTPILDWLGVREVREHGAQALGSVAILDLPDMDSVQIDHRDRVEAVLPRVDAVAWVTDPEKYADAVLHDTFLRTWVPRLDRQAMIVNKADRLAQGDRRRVERDVEQDVARSLAQGDASRIPVLLTTAVGAEADIDALRSWLADGVAAKAIVRARVGATVVDLARRLARDAGIDPARPATPFLSERARAAAIEDAAHAVLRAIDLPGLERQAVAATRARARALGAGPLGQLTALVYRFSGRSSVTADPGGFLLRWRERAPIAPAIESLRQALATPLADASPKVRPSLAATLEPVRARQGLERSIDRAIGGLDRLEAPTSRWWSLIGFLQTLATAGTALTAAWLVVWILAKPRVDSVEVPGLGAVPVPFAMLVGFVVVGYLLARTLGLHAGWVGRRWAGGVRARVATSVKRELIEHGFAALDRLEAARRRLTEAVATILHDCGRP